MTPDEATRALLDHLPDTGELILAMESPTGWVLDELSYVRRQAQAEAQMAYEAWDRSPDAEAYTVYRAAQDRADAAQDALAQWARNSSGKGRGPWS